MPQPGFGGSAAPMNIDQLQNMAMNVVENVCSVVCMPVEVILRPQYGTRYFPVPVIFFSALMMIMMPLFSAVAIGLTRMIPFVRVQLPMGMFDIGSLSKLYFILAVVHGIRLYRRMIHMELEQNSEFEGPPLPFFRLIPWSRSFWCTRIVLEPAFVFIAAIILGNMFIFQAGLVFYLHFAALALAMKNFIGWYKAWAYLRQLMDMRFAAPIIAKLVENQATEDDLAPIHLASFPKNLSPDMRQTAVSHIARQFSPDGETPAPAAPVHASGPNSNDGGNHEHHS